MVGKTISHYQVLEKIGQGGMGVVYKALDSHLKRLVVLKVLPPEKTADPDRKQRFVREARAASALNHPNIVTVHDIEQADGIDFIAMEYVQGNTLSHLIGRKGLKLDEALKYGTQIADALEAAHNKGIIHRDLKPSNIMVDEQGLVKVLDFGLAKLTEQAPLESDESTRTLMPTTGEGAIVGTAAYMSPEQARATTTDKRSDIWAFGCVLYEMLTGKRVFRGESSSDVLAAILNTEPDWSALPADTPPGISRLLRRCLQKNPRQRLHDMADARIEIVEATQEDNSPAVSRTGKGNRLPLYLWALILFLTMAAFGIGVWWNSSRAPKDRGWTGVRLGGSMVALGPRISPDGQLVAFQALVDGVTQVAVMKPESGNWQVLTHDTTRGIVQEISWSRDGTRLFFDRYSGAFTGIFSVPVLGGEERLVLEEASLPLVLPDNSLLIARQNSERRLQLHRFWPESGRIQPLKALLRGEVASSPVRVTTSGDRVVFMGTPLDNPSAPEGLYAMDLSSENVIRVAPEVAVPSTNPFALAPAADGKSVLFSLPFGDLSRIVSAPINGSVGLRPLLTLTTTTGYLDAGSDGSIYADQWERPLQVVRFSPLGGTVEYIGNAAGMLTLALPDGRVVFSSRTAGRYCLMAAAAGKEPEPLVETQAETDMPATSVGASEVAFLIGERPSQTIAVASTIDGRIHRRLNGAKGGDIRSMAAFPDGQTIYYTASGSLWSIPVADGQPQKLGPGDVVTADPSSRELLVRLDEREGVRLVRRSITDGHERPVRVGSNVRLVAGSAGLSPTAIGKDGKILVQVSVGSSWFWPAASLDPQTGRAQIMNIGYPADMPAPGWAPGGRIIGVAAPLRSSLWRFRPAGDRK